MNYRNISFAVVCVLLSLPGFSQSALVEGVARSLGTGAKVMAGRNVAAVSSKITRSVVPMINKQLTELPAFTLASFNANTIDFSNINNGRGYAFLKYHADFLKNLGSTASFEGFFLPTVESLQTELAAPLVNPTHASQALYDAAHEALTRPSGFFGVKMVQDNGVTDVLILDVNTGEWQSFQKFLGKTPIPEMPITK